MVEKSSNLILVNSNVKKVFKKEKMRLIKNIIKFILFDIFVLSIFFINNYNILLCLFLINIVCIMLFKLNIIKLLRYLLYLIPIIGLTFVINIFLLNVTYAFLIASRFLIACISTYIFSRTVTVLEISKVIEILLSPLKLIKVDVKSIGLLVSIAISFIPIIKDEMIELKQIMASKGYIMKVNNVHLFIRPLLTSVFKRTNEIEKAIIAKGYSEV